MVFFLPVAGNQIFYAKCSVADDKSFIMVIPVTQLKQYMEK